MTVVGLAVATCSVLTVVTELPSGRFNLGTVGLDQSLAGIDASFSHGGGRVLWIGDPRVLPASGWSIEPGLSYATTTSTVASAWSILPAGAALSMRTPAAIDAVLHGTTVTAGELFAEDAITTIVVVGSAAPSIANPTVLSPDPAPSALVAGLRLQGDLAEQSNSGGLDVFTVTNARPLVAWASQPRSARFVTGSLLRGPSMAPSRCRALQQMPSPHVAQRSDEQSSHRDLWSSSAMVPRRTSPSPCSPW